MVAVLACFLAWGLRRPPIGVMDGAEVIEMTIYDTIGLPAEDTENGLLENVPHVTVSEDVTRRCLPSFVYCTDRPLWKGGFLAVVRTKDARSYQIEISAYGGFFRVPGERGYYRLDQAASAALQAELRRILTETFIPQRPGYEADQRGTGKDPL